MAIRPLPLIERSPTHESWPVSRTPSQVRAFLYFWRSGKSVAPAIAATNDVVFVICLKAGSVLSVGACFPLLFECFRRIGKPYRWPQARVRSLARNQSREQHAGTTKSGGREPAVVGKPNAVRRKSPTIRRRCDGRTRAAGVSPPWSVNRTRCDENRPPFDDDATDEQERRASARRAIRKTHLPGRLSKGAGDCRCSARDPRCHCGEAAFSLLESTCAADVLPETPLPLRYHNHGRVQASATG